MKTELKVGIFVLLGLGVLAYLSTRVSDGPKGGGKGTVIKARFDNVAGLVVGAEVRAAGVRVGRVKSIGLEPERGKAVVELEFFEGIDLPKNSVASIASLGLLGEKYVEIKVPDVAGAATRSHPDAAGRGGQGGGPLEAETIEIETFEQGDVIEVERSAGLEEISELASDIADDVKAVTRELRRAVGEGDRNRVQAILMSLERFSASLETVVAENQPGIGRVVANLDRSTETLREVLAQNQRNIDRTAENVASATETLDRILERNEQQFTELVANMRDLTGALKEVVAENRSSLSRSVENVETASGALGERLPSILEKLDRVMGRLDTLVTDSAPQVDESLGNVRSASVGLERTMDSVSSIAEKIDEGKGTVGKLINDEELHDNLNRTLASLRETLGGFQKFRTYLRMRAEGQFGEEFGGKGYFGVDLIPNPKKFYRIELLAAEDGVEFRNRAETTITIGDAPPTTVVTEERLFLDQISISAVYGRRWKNFSLYGGMLEYRGGLGLDYRFLDNRAYVNFEVFDFGHPVAPHMKLSANYFVTPSVLLSAGWDDPLNDENSQPFVGLGFVLEDEDIKNLLGLAASAGP